MKRLNILTYAIMAISVVVTVYFFLSTTEERAGVYLIWTYILFAATVILVVILPLFNMVSNPKALKKTAINLGFIILVFGLSYLLASDTQTPVTAALDSPPSAVVMKLTDMGIMATYFLFTATVLVIILGPVLTAIRNR